MLIVPELKKVVITPPRSGSTALRALIREKYEHATSPFRHGEVAMLGHCELFEQVSDGEWSIVYILRDPLQRMISLWRYMHDVSYTRNARASKEWVDRINKDADRPFNDWLWNSTELFNESNAKPGDWSVGSQYCTFFNVPATRKSAAQFLRYAPDRSVEIVNFLDSKAYKRVLGVNPQRLDGDVRNDSTKLFAKVGGCGDFISKWHKQDLNLMRLK